MLVVNVKSASAPNAVPPLLNWTCVSDPAAFVVAVDSIVTLPSAPVVMVTFVPAIR